MNLEIIGRHTINFFNAQYEQFSADKVPLIFRAKIE